MVKKLLSDFTTIVNPNYQPTAFRPYLLMIFSIVFVTIVGFGVQKVTTKVNQFAANPTAFQNNLFKQIGCDWKMKFPFSSCQEAKQVDKNSKKLEARSL